MRNLEEERTYSASHFVARNRKEEKVSSTRIIGEESALSDVLEEVAFAGVFAGEFPRRVEIGFRISVGIHEDLELLLHLLVVEAESLLRRVEDAGGERQRATMRIGIGVGLG